MSVPAEENEGSLLSGRAVGESSSDLFEIDHGLLSADEFENDSSVFSFEFKRWKDSVFVAVGRTESSSSMDALEWTLKHLVSPDTVVHLIHVFPVIRHIPSPLGNLPRRQVNPEMAQIYVSREREKRKKLLQKFLDRCSASKVEADLVLIEGDDTGKAILGVIPVLNVTKLVLGTSKSSLRKTESRKGGGIADKVLNNAPEACEIKIICEGQEVIDRMMGWSSPSSSSNESSSTRDEVQLNVSFLCMRLRLWS